APDLGVRKRQPPASDADEVAGCHGRGRLDAVRHPRRPRRCECEDAAAERDVAMSERCADKPLAAEHLVRHRCERKREVGHFEVPAKTSRRPAGTTNALVRPQTRTTRIVTT